MFVSCSLVRNGYLSSSDIIPWSKLSPMLIFHRSTRQTLSFLTSSNQEEKSNLLFDLYRRFLLTQKKEVSQYEEMTTEELNKELLKIVGHSELEPLSTPSCTTSFSSVDRPSVSALGTIGSSTPSRNTAAMCTVNNAAYVITSDNFLKMIRIAIKIEARIPVLISICYIVAAV